MSNEEPAVSPDAQGAPITLRKWQAEALPIAIDALKQKKRPIIAAFMGAGKSVLIAELIRRSREQEGRGVVVLAPRTALVEQLSATFGKVLGPENVGQWWEARKQADRRVTVSTYQSLPTLVDRWKANGRSCSLLVCDEAHRTEADAILDAVSALEGLAPGRWLARIGVTATPFRSSKKEALSLWDSVAFRYSYADAVRDGVVVPHRVIGWSGTGNADETDKICTEMLLQADCWPALASAKTIVDAEAFAVHLTAQGIRSAAIHSQLPGPLQKARIDALKSGALRCLVHVSMLSEGSDFPWLRTLLLRRPVGAKVRFVQEVGRVLRVDPENPGKVDGLILDPFDLFGDHGLKHPEALGRMLDGEDPAVDKEESEGELDKEREEKKRPAVRKTAVYVWLWNLCTSLEDHGLELSLVANREILCTPKQVETIGQYAKILRYFPGEKGKERIRAWIKDGRLSCLTRREAGMLISFLFWLSNATREARKHGALTGDWNAANRLFSWPADVTVPDDVPELEIEKQERELKESQKKAVK